MEEDSITELSQFDVLMQQAQTRAVVAEQALKELHELIWLHGDLPRDVTHVQLRAELKSLLEHRRDMINQIRICTTGIDEAMDGFDCEQKFRDSITRLTTMI